MNFHRASIGVHRLVSPPKGLLVLAYLLSCLLAGLLAGARPASAQPAGDATNPDGSEDEEEEGTVEERARSHFRVGELLYGEGRFPEAADEFDRAFELSGRPELLYNSYLAHRDAGRLPEAVDRLRQYLAGTPNAPNRETLERRLAAMEETLAEQERIAAMSDEERAALEEERRRAAEEAEAQRAEAEALRREQARDEGRRQPLPYIVLGAGGAMLVGGAIAGVIAKIRIDDLDAVCPNQVCISGVDVGELRRPARRAVIATDTLIIAGAATAVTGVVLLMLQLREHADPDDIDPEATTARVDAGCTRRGCNLELGMTF